MSTFNIDPTVPWFDESFGASGYDPEPFEAPSQHDLPTCVQDWDSYSQDYPDIAHDLELKFLMEHLDDYDRADLLMRRKDQRQEFLDWIARRWSSMPTERLGR